MAFDWDKLRVFHAAAEAGSFTHAAENLHLSQSAISRQVSALEQDGGGRLSGVRLAGGALVACRALAVAPRFTAM